MEWRRGELIYGTTLVHRLLQTGTHVKILLHLCCHFVYFQGQMLVHLCLSVLLTVISPIVILHCYLWAKNDDDDIWEMTLHNVNNFLAAPLRFVAPSAVNRNPVKSVCKRCTVTFKIYGNKNVGIFLNVKTHFYIKYNKRKNVFSLYYVYVDVAYYFMQSNIPVDMEKVGKVQKQNGTARRGETNFFWS